MGEVQQTASTPKSLKFRIQMLEFYPGILGSKLPVYRGFLPVPLGNPCLHFTFHHFTILYPPIKTLAAEYPDFQFRHV